MFKSYETGNTIENMARKQELTVSELRVILGQLEHEGYGDYTVLLTFDSGLDSTSTNGFYKIYDKCKTVLFEESERW